MYKHYSTMQIHVWSFKSHQSLSHHLSSQTSLTTCSGWKFGVCSWACSLCTEQNQQKMARGVAKRMPVSLRASIDAGHIESGISRLMTSTWRALHSRTFHMGFPALNKARFFNHDLPQRCQYHWDYRPFKAVNHATECRGSQWISAGKSHSKLEAVLWWNSDQWELTDSLI